MAGNETPTARGKDQGAHGNTGDRVIGVILLLIGAAIVWQSHGHLRPGTLHHPGPGFFPLLLGCLIMFLSAFLVFSPEKGPSGGPSFSARNFKRIGPVYIGLLVFFAILEYAGFLISTFLLILYLFILTGKRKVATSIAGALVITVLAYLLFGLALKGELPKGFLGL